jgi:putative DNA primase/helicase
VLAWAVRGCLCWRDYGLGEAKDVVSATDAYRAEMDVLAGFVSQCCDMRSGVWCWSGELYEAYLDWCKATGEKPESQKAFGARLKERGLVNVAKGKARRISWVGITLKGALPA